MPVKRESHGVGGSESGSANDKGTIFHHISLKELTKRMRAFGTLTGEWWDREGCREIGRLDGGGGEAVSAGKW